MQAASNNHYKGSLSFDDGLVQSNNFSEDNIVYENQTNLVNNQERINRSCDQLSPSPSSTNHVINKVMDLLKKIPSPSNLSTTDDTNEVVSRVSELIAQYSLISERKFVAPIHRDHRIRVRPKVDAVSDSTDSFVTTNNTRLNSSKATTTSSSFGGTLDYVHDNRFDSTTTVDRVKNDIIAVELAEQLQRQSMPLVDPIAEKKENLSWVNRLDSSIRLLPTNVLAYAFMCLIGGFFISIVVIIIIA